MSDRAARHEPVEQALRHPVGVVAGLQQERRDRRHQHAFGHPGRAVGSQVAGDLPGAHRVPDQHRLPQVQVVQQAVQVGGEGVVVVADDRLAGLAEAAAVIGDDPVAGLQQDRDLLVPGPAAERIPVDQHDRLARAVVLVVDLDIGGVLPTDGDFGHERSFLSGSGLHPGDRPGDRPTSVAATPVRFASRPAHRARENPWSIPRPFSCQLGAAGVGAGESVVDVDPANGSSTSASTPAIWTHSEPRSAARGVTPEGRRFDRDLHPG